MYYVPDVSYVYVYVIFNQHFILGLLYVIVMGVKVNACVWNISGVMYLYIWVICGYESQITIYVSVVCIYCSVSI